MTKSSPEIVQAYFEAIRTGNVDAAVDLLAADVVWHVDGGSDVPTAGLFYGRAQVRKWLSSFPGNFEPRGFQFDGMVEGEDDILVLGRFRHLILPTNRFMESDFVMRFNVRDGQIKRYQIFEDSLVLAKSFDQTDAWLGCHISINGTKYAYSDSGDGPTILFTHGLFVDRTLFSAQIDALSSNFRCISFDMPGHGQSEFKAEGFSLDDIALDLELFIQEHRLGPVIFVGQSMGGMVGIRLAAKRPDLLVGLVLIGTSARSEFPERLPMWQALREIILTGTDEERSQAFQNVQAQVNDSKWLESNTPHAHKIALSHDRLGLYQAIDAAVLNRGDIREMLPQVSTQTLILCGEEDSATPIDLSKEMNAKIAKSSFLAVKHGGHHLPAEAADAVTSHIRAFVEECTSNSNA